MAADERVLDQVSSLLGRYVYMLVDPRDSMPFYVGKGQGIRFMSHGRAVPEGLDESEGTKAARIRGIRTSGLEPEVWIARYGLSQGEYTAVEGAVIDVLMSFPIRASRSSPYRPLAHQGQLTNARRESARGHGIVHLDRLIDDFAAPPLTTRTPLLLIKLGHWTELDGEIIAGGRRRNGAGFRQEWYDPAVRNAHIKELGISVSAWWRVSPRNVAAAGIEHAVAVFRRVTRGIFRIDHDSWEKRGPRAAFWFEPVTTGPLFDEVIGSHGHLVLGMAKGAQNSIYYWPRPDGTPLATPAPSP